MTTQININQTIITTVDIPNISSVTFDYLGEKVYSADRYERIYGIFVSDPIIASSNLLKWNQISWDATKDSNSEIFLFVKSGVSESALEITPWSNLLINSPSDISKFTGQYIQFMIVMRCDNQEFSIPNVDRVSLSYFASESAVRFFTKAFNLGFKPKHVLLTYNADETDDSIIRFAISGEDSADLTKYQYIDPNKIEKLTGISRTSEHIKVLLEIVGSSETEIVVHEFALMFSGEEASRVNKLAMESSSSSSSSYSSSSSSSSSSSLDSSSSSSLGESSSSSSLGESSSSSSIDSSSSSSSTSLDSSSSSSSSLMESSSSSSESSADIIYYAEGFGFTVFNGIYTHDGKTKVNGRPLYVNDDTSNVKIYWDGSIWKMTDSVNAWYKTTTSLTNPFLLYEGQWEAIEILAEPAGYISSIPFSSSSGV